MYFVGIDLGTSSVKVIAADEAGRIAAVESRSYPLQFPRDGWAEQNPEDWLQGTVAALRGLLDKIDGREVRGLAVGGQMHGLVLLDDRDQVIRPAILWNDGRSQKEVRFLNEIIGTERLRAQTGNIAFAGFTAPKLLWMQENEPKNFARIAKILLPKDYLVYRLTGEFCTDVSDASGTLLFDVRVRRWSQEMCALCGVRPGSLGRVYESAEPVGVLRDEYAALFGGHAVTVAAGAGDNAAAAVGMGTVGAGRCNLSVGTSGTVFMSASAFQPEVNQSIHQFAHADGGWHLMGCMLSAAACSKWWFEDILRTQDFAGEETAVGELGSNSLYFLPYLMGERSPHNDPSARGAFIGLRLNTTRAQMTQAVLEGVAFGLRDSLELMGGAERPQRVTLCGGGAKSPLWRQMLADVLGVEIERAQAEEGPAYGAAMLAATACGLFPSVQQAATQWVKIAEHVLPQSDSAARYEKHYQIFRTLYPALRGLL